MGEWADIVLGRGELTEREQREPEREHLLRDPEGGAVIAPLTPDKVGAVERGELQIDPAARVWIETNRGNRYQVKGDEAQRAIAAGSARLVGSQAERAIEHEATLEQAYGDRPGLAFGQGLASGASLGLFDLGARALGYGEQVREVAERSPTASLVGELGGAIGTAAVSGGASLAERAASAAPAAMAGRVGGAVARRLGGGFAARSLGLATEGAIFGAGAGAAELGRMEDPLTIERAASTIATKALVGGLAGFGVSVLGKAASKGLARAKGVIDDAVAKADDVAPIVGEIEGYTRARRGAFLVANPEGVVGAKAPLGQASKRILGALNTPEYLAKRPGIVAQALEAERKVLRELVEEGDEAIMRRLADADRKVADALDARIDKALDRGRKTLKIPRDHRTAYRDVAGMRGKRTEALTVKVEDAQRVVGDLRSGALMPKRAQAVAELPDMLAQNRALSDEVNRLADAGGRGFGDAMLDRASGAVVGAAIGGPVGGALGIFAPTVLGKVNKLVTERLAKAAAEAATRTSAAIDAIVTKGATAAKVAVPTASKVLAAVSYAPPAKVLDVGAPAKASGMVSDFRARERELRELTEPTPEGGYKMRRAARMQLGARLDGARAASPIVADKIEALAARRVAFLAGKLPKRPDSAALPIGPDTWRPSDFQIRQFARFAAAVEDPGAVEERISAGTVTPEDAEAYREVYPERFAALQVAVMERLPELQHRLEYPKRLGLSIMLGVPVDPAMDPRVLAVLQATYEAEDGTQGGTAPPTARPHFGATGSLPSAKPTDAQERAG